MKWLERAGLEARVASAVRDYPVTLLLGPRQCGKTSLARRLAVRKKATYFDLEDPEAPLCPEVARTLLKDLKGLVVIDEVQRQPELFALLRVLADRRPIPARFLILGSAAPSIVKGVSESLAGRVAYIEMAGFALTETDPSNREGILTRSPGAGWKKLWLRGGLPDSYLASSNAKSREWRMNFIQTFLERDIPQLGIRVPAAALRRFWTMLAHFHGQIWNSADLARAMGVKEDTARHYLDILTGAFMVRQLQPWFENTGKRVVKAPKVYFRDTGLLHALLGTNSLKDLLAHPRFGASWEGFALDEIIRATGAEKDAYFYRTHAGAELDLVLMRGGRRYGFEFKFSDKPEITRSMHIAIEDLKLSSLKVVYPGDRTWKLSDKIEAVPLTQIADAVRGIKR